MCDQRQQYTSYALENPTDVFGTGDYQRHREGSSTCCGNNTQKVLKAGWTCITATICLSGIVLLVAEYHQIPDCASRYRCGSIVITVLFGLLCVVGQYISRMNLECNRKTVCGSAGLLALESGLIGGLVYHEVWTTPATSCDVSEISGLTSWMYATIVIEIVMAGLGLLVMVVGRFHSGFRNRVPSLTGLEEP
jgi:hypothetical protein